jgi:polyribonucleotide nucleotidyltransferase
VVAFVYSADKENDPDVLGINGASCALALSDIPVPRPGGRGRDWHCRWQYIVNPTYAERAKSTLNIMVVGTKDGIVMVESGAKEMLRRERRRRDRVRSREIKKICAAIEDLVSRAGKTKRTVHPVEIDHEYLNALTAKVGDRLKDALDTQKHPKFESYALVKEIKDELKKELPRTIRRKRRSSASTTSCCARTSSASRC